MMRELTKHVIYRQNERQRPKTTFVGLKYQNIGQVNSSRKVYFNKIIVKCQYIEILDMFIPNIIISTLG